MANRFMEIAKLVESPDNIRRDMDDALELAREHFRGKYLKRIRKAIEHERMKSMTNPPREVALIAALKEFTTPENHETYDRMAEAMITLSSWQEIRKNINSANWNAPQKRLYAQNLAADGVNSALDASLHHDGVYDIDPECRPNNIYNSGRLAEMMFMLSLIGK